MTGHVMTWAVQFLLVCKALLAVCVQGEDAPNLGTPNLDKPNLVIGATLGLADDKLYAFLGSARTSFAPGTKVVLIDNGTRPLYEEFGVQAYFSTSPAMAAGQGKLGKVMLRFWHVCHFLEEHGDKYGYVAHLDVSDVIFQADPFEAAQPFLSRYGGVLLHNEQGTVDSSWGNSWNLQVIKHCFGTVSARKLARRVPICACFQMGTPADMTNLICNMVKTSRRKIQTKVACNDQAIITPLVHSGVIKHHVTTPVYSSVITSFFKHADSVHFDNVTGHFELVLGKHTIAPAIGHQMNRSLRGLWQIIKAFWKDAWERKWKGTPRNVTPTNWDNLYLAPAKQPAAVILAKAAT